MTVRITLYTADEESTIYVKMERRYYEFLKEIEKLFSGAYASGGCEPLMQVVWMEEEFANGEGE